MSGSAVKRFSNWTNAQNGDSEKSQDDDKPSVDIETEEKLELPRELGLPTALGLVFGFVVGTGIFISPKGVMEASGSVGLTMTVWVFGGFYALLDGLCHAELGTMIHKGGGDYTYLQKGVGNFWAFSRITKGCLFSIPISTVIVSQTFASYFVTFLPTCGHPILLQKLISAALIVSFYCINVYSSRIAARINTSTAASKFVALVVIITAGVLKMAQGTTSELSSGFQNTSQDSSSLAMALFSAMYSYGGASGVNILVEEIKNPTRNIPLSIILGVVMVTIVYTLTNVAYLAVMTPAEMIASNAVAVTFADRALGPAAIIIPIAVCISTMGSLNSVFLASSRSLFIGARDKNIPDVLCYLQVDHLTPVISSTLIMILSLVYLTLPGSSYDFVNYTGFLNSLVQILVYISFLRFRLFTMKDAPRPIKVPIIIPVFILLVNSYMFVAPLALNFKAEYLYVAAAILGGSVMLYIPFIHFRWSLPFYDFIVTKLQLIFEVSPPAKFEE